MSLAVVLEGLLMTTGRTKTVLIVGVVGSWCGQVPLVAFLVTFWQPTLRAVFLGVSGGYAILNVGLSVALVRLDWSVLAQEAEMRANIGTAQPAIVPAEEVRQHAGDADTADDCKPTAAE